MHFDLSDEQKSLKRAARAFLSEYSTSERVRKAMVSPLGYEPEVWRLIGTEMGWPALIIPEEYGGAGGTYVDLAAVMEECGYFLLCSPLFSTVMATNALLIAGSEEQKREYLPKIAAGELTATVAMSEPRDQSSTGVIGFQTKFRREADDFVLDGIKSNVINGNSSDLILALAHEGEFKGSLGRELTLFAVPRNAKGIECRPQSTMDQTRHQSLVYLREVRVPNSGVIGEIGGGWITAWRAIINQGIAILAAEQTGGARRCLDMAVDYAKTRVQFGRAIGSFQAIKHECAEMMLHVESSRSLAYYAAWSIGNRSADDYSEWESAAKVFCTSAYFHCASTNLQIHGGIGFTWEHDAHLHLKRANSSSAILGDQSDHRTRISQEVRRM